MLRLEELNSHVRDILLCNRPPRPRNHLRFLRLLDPPHQIQAVIALMETIFPIKILVIHKIMQC